MIEFRTLGTLDLRRTNGPELDSLLAQPKRVALLAYLCLAGPHGFHRRDTLLGLFWPDANETRARASLRRALYVLRLALGEGAFHSRGDEEISPNYDLIWCDAVAFEQLLAANKPMEALELYRGELLPGFFLDEAPEFGRWLEDERKRLRSSAARAARLATETQESDDNLTAAVCWARREAELTDNDERTVRRLMTLLARVGDRAGALQVYDELVARLASEYEAEPSVETRTLGDQLRKGRSPSPSTAGGRPATPHPTAGESQPSNGYEIEREIGRGGAATVFLAKDLKHGRSVALKVLRPEVAVALGTKRFLDEISIAARLNHPNIVALLNSGEIDNTPFYTMPYVEGETLRARLGREGALRVDDALRIARDVADALAYAHARGVVHRDVKPENILLDNGRALVTDFGIARAITEASSQRLTQPGLTMGTAAYMSPEQADGPGDVDGRSDIYSLGCVLYEMLTGDPPFAGSSKQSVLARKVSQPAPPLRGVRESVSAGLEQTVLKALERKPADRFRTVQEFSDSLEFPVSRHSLPWRPRSTRRAATIVAAVIVATAAVFGLASTFAEPSTLPGTERRKLTFNGNTTQAILSPDGQFLGYIVQDRDSNRLIVQDLTGGPADTLLAFARAAVDHTIEWSPNGARILMKQAGKVVLIHRHGGQQTAVAGFQTGDNARWFPDGRVSLANLSRGRLVVVNPENGDSLPIRLPPLKAVSWDGAWASDGREFAVVTNSFDSARWAIRGITLDGRIEPLVEDSVQLNSPRWGGNGALYYLRGTDAIWRVNVSTRTGRATSRPEKVESGIDALPGNSGLAHFSLSRDGHQLVYAKGERYSNLFRVDPIDSAIPPRMQRLTSEASLKWSPVISPDGHWIAFAAQTKDGSELFRMAIAGGRALQITEGARIGPRTEIAWSPDGHQIAFQTVRAGTLQVWIAAVPSGEMWGIEHTNTSLNPNYLTWAPGPRIVYTTPHLKLRALNPATGRDDPIAPDTTGAFHFPRYSPDGEEIAAVHWLQKEKNRMIEIFSTAGPTALRLPTQLLFPRGWSADGRFVFAQIPFVPKLVRLDARGKKPTDALFTAPVREMECTPEPGRERPSFICMFFDFNADIWIIENFDRRLD